MSNPRFITINGQPLEVAWHGPAPQHAPTLVFLHEGLGCVALWRDFPAKLAAATGCGALVYSRLGYGRSAPCPLPRPVSYMHDEALTILPLVLKQMDIEQVILVGHSDGGSIALIYAGSHHAQQPPHLLGLITEAAHVLCETISLQAIHAIRPLYDNGDLRQRLAKYHGNNVECAFLGWNDAWQHPDFWQWNLENYLVNIHVPTLVIQGEADEYGTIAQVETIVRHTHAQQLLLPACGHTPHREQEATTLAAMTAFITHLLRK
jgi:pimeloyl-ACP methyl ester carboxylesterase